jgi:hypothetical protein
MKGLLCCLQQTDECIFRNAVFDIAELVRSLFPFMEEIES